MDVANAAAIGKSILTTICDMARAFDIPAETSDSNQASLSQHSHRGRQTEHSRSSFPTSRPRPSCSMEIWVSPRLPASAPCSWTPPAPWARIRRAISR